MPSLAFPQTSGPWRLRLTTFLLAAMAAGSAVYWLLKSSDAPGPSRQSSALQAPMPIDSTKVAQLLGASASSSPGLVAVARATDSYKLMGVIAQGSLGSALIAMDGKPAKPFHVGDKVTDNLVLHSVTARSAALAANLQSPVTTTLELPPLAGVPLAP